MEHSEAIQTMAAERYELGEMAPEERDRFEEHFFDCRECSQSVRDGATIAAGIRVGRPHRVASPGIAWFGAVAAALFAAIIGYQNLVTIPHLHTAGAPAARIVTHPVSLLMADSRGNTPPALVNVARDEEVKLYFDVPPENSYPAYVAEVRDAAGNVKASAPIAADDAHETILMLISRGLPAGRYELAVSGVNGAKRDVVALYPFEVRLH